MMTTVCNTCNKEVPRGKVNGYGNCGECAEAIRNAKNFPKTFDLQKGDKIRITVGHKVFEGIVISAAHWGIRDGWYIEFTHTTDRFLNRGNTVGAYGYWKQGCDGGTVEKLSNSERGKNER